MPVQPSTEVVMLPAQWVCHFAEAKNLFKKLNPSGHTI
jgi:hypothetical protein